MAKLTRKQRNQLDTILGGLRRARAYIERDDTVLAIRSSVATTTLHYTRPSDGSVLKTPLICQTGPKTSAKSGWSCSI